MLQPSPAAEAAASKDNLEDLCLPLVFSTPNPICERKYSGNHSMTDKKKLPRKLNSFCRQPLLSAQYKKMELNMLIYGWTC